MSLRDLTQVSDSNESAILKELQGLTISVIDGAANGTKMDVAGLRTEDTILSAIVFADTWAAPVDDKANITIQGTKATGTLTVSGNPTADQTFVVNDVTYTFKATPTAATHVKITAGNNNAMAAAVAAVVNAYENRRLPVGNPNNPAVVATVSTNVVTFTATADGAGNAPVVTDTGSTITIDSTDPAAVTATFVSAGDADAVTVNGITFTIKTTPTDADLDMAVAASDTLQAAALVTAISRYQSKYDTLDVVATSALGVVTIRPSTVKKGNLITLTEGASNVAVSGSGFLAGGTATGGIKSTTNLSAATLVLTWFNKS